MSTRQISGDFPAQGLGSPELPKSPPPPVRRQPLSQQQSETLKCPRCGSANTKFCYYNNYNKSQPRHFCKSCKRHWTRGGTLRSVPVGGGRKNKRPKISGAAKTAACGGGGRRDRHFFQLDSNVSDNQKSMSNGLYHALMSSPIPIEKSDNGGKTISSSSPFQFSSPSVFETSDSLNPIWYHESLDAFGPHQGNLDSIEESTITSANNVPTYTGDRPWPGQGGDGSLDLLDYWNWNEIDSFTSYDDFDMSFDGSKP